MHYGREMVLQILVQEVTVEGQGAIKLAENHTIDYRAYSTQCVGRIKLEFLFECYHFLALCLSVVYVEFLFECYHFLALCL